MKVVRSLGAFALIAGFSIASASATDVVAPDDVTITDDMTVEAALTSVAGDPAKGKDWFQNRKLGNCLACHANDDLSEQPFHGAVGPELNGVAERYSAAQLRAIVVNPKEIFGDQSIMPAFYAVKHLNRVADKFAGKTILDAQQVEDVVAYLMTLK